MLHERAEPAQYHRVFDRERHAGRLACLPSPGHYIKVRREITVRGALSACVL
jgi:hypothetical protein